MKLKDALVVSALLLVPNVSFAHVTFNRLTSGERSLQIMGTPADAIYNTLKKSGLYEEKVHDDIPEIAYNTIRSDIFDCTHSVAEGDTVCLVLVKQHGSFGKAGTRCAPSAASDNNNF